MKNYCPPDIVLGLQEQEHECGSEAVQIHPDSRPDNWRVTATRVRETAYAMSIGSFQYIIRTSACRVQQNALLQA